jgi:predicted nucleic acid-binding protein
MGSVKNRIGDSQLTIEFLDRYKPREIERTMYDSSPAEDLAALAFTKKAEAPFQLDFDDALHYATAKRNNLVLVTFDHDFDRTDLTRAAPADILSRYN